MEDESKKAIKYLTNQPATVHNYGKLSKSESPRTHSSPTSILRKFPHSLRHDQKHQTKIKRNSSPVNVIISGISVSREQWEMNRKSWSFGDDISDESEERPSSEGSEKYHESYNCENSPSVKRKLSESSVSSECSNDSEVWKLQPTIVNTNNYASVHECNKKSENASCQTINNLSSSEKLVFEKQETTIGSISKLSVINNLLNDCKTENDGFSLSSVNKMSEFSKKVQFPIHKSTPNLLRCSVSHPERITDRSREESNSCDGKSKSGYNLNPSDFHVPLRGSDSLPHLDQRHRINNTILPKINRTISELPEDLSNLKKNNLAKTSIKSESHINSQNLYNNAIRQREPYFSLSNIFDVGRKSDVNRFHDESEKHNLIDDSRNAIVRPRKNQKELKNRWSYKKTVGIMPNLRNLMGRRIKGDSNIEDVAPMGAAAPLMTTSRFGRSESFTSLNIPQIKYIDADDEDLSVKKCETVYALTSLIRAESSFHVEPIKPVNRLRIPPTEFSGSTSRMCSRCSSLLSMASSSRYSINTTGSGFVSCNTSGEKIPEPNILCKLCLMEVPVSMSLKLDFCGCVFCKDCMRLYVEFEIQEGAYDISCPDAQCNKQGIVSTDEVETLVMPKMMERYRRFRLNHEVDMDRNRTWCPRAGCETVCNICPREKCAPTSVHCPTCDTDFCSNCKNAWHKGLTCEENSKKLAKEGRTDFMEPGIPFDSDSIKCCPMCNVPIEKDEGCAQMMCKRCKHVFCWYCLASLDDDFLLRHYDKGPCKNKLGHTRASVIWHRTQVIGIFAGLGLLLLVASPLLLLAAPCIVCCKCRVCSGTKLDAEDDLPEESGN